MGEDDASQGAAVIERPVPEHPVIEHQGGALVPAADAPGQQVAQWQPTEAQVELVKRQLMPGATDDELQLFVGVAQRTGLDPFARQIHAVKRRERLQDGGYGERWSFQVGIDGFRVIAQRTGQYAGQQGPWWCASDGQWTEMWDHEKGPPVAARVGVLRYGFAEPLYRVAHYREYVQTTRSGDPNQMWRQMPANQLAKCAEALALRAAFPAELSGLYTPDEMAQAEQYTGAHGPQHDPTTQAAATTSDDAGAQEDTPPAQPKSADKPQQRGAPAQQAAYEPVPGYTPRFQSLQAVLAYLAELSGSTQVYPWAQLMAAAVYLVHPDAPKVGKFGELPAPLRQEAWLRMNRVADWLDEHCGAFPPPAREDVEAAMASAWEGVHVPLAPGTGQSRAERLAQIAAGNTQADGPPDTGAQAAPAGTPAPASDDAAGTPPAATAPAQAPTAPQVPTEDEYNLAAGFVADPRAYTGGAEPSPEMLAQAQAIVDAYQAAHPDTPEPGAA